MANLTITIDDELLKRARLRALERNTSVNALLREYLEVFAGAGDRSATATREAVHGDRPGSEQQQRRQGPHVVAG